jgi:hypothetical protein
MRRRVVAPPELAEAHAQFKAAIVRAYGSFRQAKKALGFCASGTCMEPVRPAQWPLPKATLCVFHLAYQARWNRRHPALTRAQRLARLTCDTHGVHREVCGCDD